MKTYRLFILILGIVFTLSIVQCKEILNIRRAVLAEVKKYPKLEIQDLYKLAYQAAMGNEHFINDTAAVRNSLNDELAAVDALSDEPLIEYLTSDNSIARVNLRAFKAQQGNPLKLIEAMIRTSSSVQSSTDLLRQFWSDVEALAEAGRIPFGKEDLDNYFNAMEKENYPAVHHSQAVDSIYHPSYRIVNGKLFSIQ
jgi:hypothetical protein